MEHYRLRKYRGPETWARVRKAYEAGESGPSCALRFDVGLANLRKRARNEGWDRKSLALKHDLKPMRGEADPPEPAVGPLDPEAVREPAASPPAPPKSPVPKVVASLKGCAMGDTAPEYNPLEMGSVALREAAWRAHQGDGKGALEMLKVCDHLMDSLAMVDAARMKANQRDREEEENRRAADERKLWNVEDQLSDLRREILDEQHRLETLQAEILTARQILKEAHLPAQPGVAQPPATDAEPAPKARLSFEERVKAASGKSGPVSRW